MRSLLICLALLLCTLSPAWGAKERAAASDQPKEPKNGYVGSVACGSCHEEEFARFRDTSKKSHSWNSVKLMAPKLTLQELQGCYSCHTTGYEKGGFVDYESTPQFADVGCETCHGPGQTHASSGDPSAINRNPSEEECRTCHNAKRVKAFNFKPLMHGGAH